MSVKNSLRAIKIIVEIFSRCISENGKYLKSNLVNSIFVYDEIINSTDSVSSNVTNAISTNMTNTV